MNAAMSMNIRPTTRVVTGLETFRSDDLGHKIHISLPCKA